MHISNKKIIYLAYAAILLLIGAQFIRPDMTNPAINPERTFETVMKPAPEVAAIIHRACSNCHSNNTTWPWYSHIAPASWLIASDVREGRDHLNFSEWGLLNAYESQRLVEAACREIKGGDMPPLYYRPMHPESWLSEKDISTLCNLAGGIDNP